MNSKLKANNWKWVVKGCSPESGRFTTLWHSTQVWGKSFTYCAVFTTRLEARRYMYNLINNSSIWQTSKPIKFKVVKVEGLL
jgi:hypothetical protein